MGACSSGEQKQSGTRGNGATKKRDSTNISNKAKTLKKAIHEASKIGDLNLDNRAVTSNLLAKSCSVYCKEITNLSLAKNNLTDLEFLSDAKRQSMWPKLEKLDVHGNPELYQYTGLALLGKSLKAINLGSNEILKVLASFVTLTFANRFI